jgi:hypothetical protein
MAAGPTAPTATAATDRRPAPRPPHDPERDPLVPADVPSWRDMPLEISYWETTYKRHGSGTTQALRLWHDSGRWQRLLAALGDDAQEETM